MPHADQQSLLEPAMPPVSTAVVRYIAGQIAQAAAPDRKLTPAQRAEVERIALAAVAEAKKVLT